MTHDEARNLLNGKIQKKINHNTYLRNDGNGNLSIVFYNTAIVTICEDGTYVLNSGGFRTVTTKERIRQYTPAKLYQEKKQWMIGDELFTDGVIVGEDGEIVPEVPFKKTANRYRPKLLPSH